jgi:hypothetical protein
MPRLVISGVERTSLNKAKGFSHSIKVDRYVSTHGLPYVTEENNTELPFRIKKKNVKVR